MDWKNFIDKNILDTKNRISNSKINYLKKNNYHLYQNIFDDTIFLNDINPVLRQRLYHLYNNLNNIPICKVCQNKVNFKDFVSGYRDYCSLRCRNIGTKEKREKTCLKKYGYKTPLENKETKSKGCLKKYGADNFAKTDEFKNFISTKRFNETDDEKQKRFDTQRKSFLKKYGVEWYSKTDLWKQQYYDSRKDILKKSFDNIQKQSDILKLEILNDEDYYLNNKKLKFKCENGHIFEKNSDYLTSNFYRIINGCPYCYKNGISKLEKEIVEFLKSNNIKNIIENTKKVITPQELDIYLPDYNLAIEFNGIYWHSEISGNKDRNYHLNKTELCYKKDIQLIHIFENEWLEKKEIIQSILLSKLNKIENKIYARKCIVKEIDNKTKNKFLEENHLQGKDISKVKLGLYYNNELVSIMTFGKRKITYHNPEWEIIRFCNKKFTIVVGGANKLFHNFINNYEYDNIKTYSDKRFGIGNIYEKLGFQKISESKPNYWYFKQGYVDKLYNRVNFQKHKLENKLDNYDKNISEFKNMINNSYDRIWDCGNVIYKYKQKGE